jgi:hypothetical protein
MKEFGLQLAELIYIEKRDNDYILQIFQSANIDPDWLLEQIKIVRDNPAQWNPSPQLKKIPRR